MDEKKISVIGVLTSGGDAPGMNPCIRAIVRTAVSRNVKVFGVRGGYEGLIHGNFIEMGARDVGGIMQRGGTVIQTARSEEFRTPHGQREAIRQMNDVSMDGLLVLGGDGSLNGAYQLAQQGVHIVGVPASIDNDIYGTDMCIGTDTALNTIVDAIDKLRDTASSHSRAFLVETMGRECGYLAVQAGIISGAEMVLIPEITNTIDEVIQTVESAYRRGKTHCIIIVAEGASLKVNEVSDTLAKMDLGFTMRVTILGHIQRGGKPSAFDRFLATRFGVAAVETLLSGKSNVMIGLQGRDMLPVPLEEIISHKRTLSSDYLDMARILAL
jgi:6-phosphofructokinase 1